MSKKPLEPTAADFDTPDALPFRLIIPLSYIAQQEAGEEITDDRKRKLSYLSIWNAVSRIAAPTTPADIDKLFDAVIDNLNTIPRIPIEDDTEGDVPPDEQRGALDFNWAVDHRIEMAKTIGRAAGVCKFFFYLKDEFKKDEYGGKTLGEIERESYDENNQLIKGSLFDKAVAIANAKLQESYPSERVNLLRINAKKTDFLEYPVDKPNNELWNMLEDADPNGQIKFDLSPSKASFEAPAFYSINFESLEDEAQISKRLTPTDKRIYIAAAAMWNSGNEVLTLTQLYKVMGNTGRPNGDDLKAIDERITKMNRGHITFDNLGEVEAYKVKGRGKGYPHFKYDGSLLPMERITAEINGQITDAAIHLFREPPLVTFAKQRKQVTTISVKLLQSPINKSDANYQIEDYLIERLSRAKLKSKSVRILYETLYKHAGIPVKSKGKKLTETEKKQRQRAPKKINRYLDYYKKQEFISRYTVEEDGVTVYF